MSKSKNSMTKSALLRRGWTNELIETLLPKPTYVHIGDGRKVLRTWRKSAVTEAEQTPEFMDKHRIVAPEAETVFLTTNLEYSYLSSTIVKEVAAFGGDISQFVPEIVIDRLREKMIKKGECK